MQTKFLFFIFANKISIPSFVIMKKYPLILILFLLPYLASAQKKSIDGFMDIPFGSDSATVKAVALAKGGVKLSEFTKKDQLGFSNLTLSQRPVLEFIVRFVDNKASDGYFFFEYDDDIILESYNNLIGDITAVYGKPSETNNFDDLNNTNKIKKLRSGNIVIKTVWISKNKNAISLTITPIGQSLQLMLRYEDDSLLDVAAVKRRADL